MNIFRNLLISRKLLVGFAFCSAFTLLIGVFAISKINNMRQEVTLVARNAAQVQSLLTLRGLLNELRIYQIQLTNTQDPKRVEDYLTRIDKTGTALTETVATMPADPIEPKDKAEGDQLVAQVADFSAAGAALVAAVQSGDATTTEKLLSGDTLKLRRATASMIDTMIGAREERGAGFRAQSATNFTTAVTAIGIGTVIAVLVSFGCGLLIARSITRPLGYAVEVTQRVSEGNLSAVEHDGRRDEPGQLLSAMERMVSLLGNFSRAQDKMARQHDAGWIDHRIQVQEFPGSFGEIAQNVNDLVDSHIRAKRHAMELLGAYARGDFSRQSERLPNQKAFVHEALDSARENMRAISQEMKRLVGAATAGDFSARGNEASFDHEFRDMVSQLNQLMAISERSFQEMSGVFTALSEGNLTVRMEGDFRGMLKDVQAAANNTVDQLTAIVSDLNHAAGTVRSEAGALRTGNQDLAARTEQQAASLEETASSMEELTSTVKMNAENARQANQLAIGASEVAGKGGDVVLQVVGTMQDIEASSRKIVDIISVIDGIAFQTNILALNAAVEAARAGEHGRGFAVVASEVRTLAQRAASAAKEITTLISTSVEKVENGSQLAGQAGATIKEVVTSVKRVTDIMAEITAASQEQSSGIEQVNKTVTQMDETTQQNAAMVEKATNSALSLDDQAQQLVTIVQRFQTRVAAQPSVSRTAPTKAAPTVKPSVTAKTASVTTPAKPAAPKVQPATARRPAARAAAATAEASDSWAEF